MEINIFIDAFFCCIQELFCYRTALSALALEYAEDVALGRDEELADLVLTGASLRKCEDVALQNALSLLPSFPALHVPVSCRASVERDACKRQRH